MKLQNPPHRNLTSAAAGNEPRDAAPAFHTLAADAVLATLESDAANGLSAAEAARRLLADGPNIMREEERGRIWRLLIGQFSNIVVWLLAVAAAVAFLTGSRLEGFAIVAVLVINAMIGFLIEWRSGRALDALKTATHTSARVRRDGAETIVNAAELVSGDIVVLASGDKVPADARLLEAAKFRSDESTLTGESEPVEKDVGVASVAAPLAERTSMAFLGTTVVGGRGLAVVTGTGERSEIGRIGKLVAVVDNRQTPLEKKLADLGRTLVYVVLGIAAIVFWAGYLRGESLWLMLEVAVSLAVAAVPEGLPAVTTLVLALGVWRMARRRAIVRRLAAVETLGATTVICTDKTGTLTENRMTVREFRMADNRAVDFTPSNGQTVPSPDANLRRLLLAGVLCNDSELAQASTSLEAESTVFLGDPTEIALLAAARDFGIEYGRERADRTKIFEQPFESAIKRMSTAWKSADGRFLTVTKGAPDAILKTCDRFVAHDGAELPMTPDKLREFRAVNEELAGRGLRVLAFADAENSSAEPAEIERRIDGGGIFLGFAGLNDPLREGARDAVRRARAAGIRVIMLTGDQLNTARTIADELKLAGDEEIVAMHAEQLSRDDPARLAETARRVHVFARVSPEEKLLIVDALQQAGEIVAVTGDGVNDAPALQKADIGVAMGQRGTEVAKEAADLVLTDDNFATIVKAIESGRTIYSNISKLVHLLFSDNISEVLLIFVAIAIGLPLPFSPLQILWINLVTDVFPALALAVEPAAPGTMHRPPRPPDKKLLSGSFLLLIAAKGLLYSSIALVAYVWALGAYGEGAHAKTIAFLAIVAVQVANLLNCRSGSRPFYTGLLRSPQIIGAAILAVLLQLAAVYFGPLGSVLGTSGPSLFDWLVIVGCFGAAVAVVEAGKFIGRRRRTIPVTRGD